MILGISLMLFQTVGIVLHLNARHKPAKFFQFVSTGILLLYFISFLLRQLKIYNAIDFFDLGFGLMLIAMTLPIYSGAFLLIREKQTRDLIGFAECQNSKGIPSPDMQWANSLRLRLKISYWAWVSSIFSLFAGSIIHLLRS